MKFEKLQPGLYKTEDGLFRIAGMNNAWFVSEKLTDFYGREYWHNHSAIHHFRTLKYAKEFVSTFYKSQEK